jgi:hypothetical protein
MERLQVTLLCMIGLMMNETRDLEIHVTLCEERYAQVNARLKRLEHVMMTGTALLLGAMGTIIALLVSKI